MTAQKVVFSFAIYGSARKYCQGLVENLELIREHYPSFHTYIYIYNDVPASYVRTYQSFDNVCLVYGSARPNMVDRFMVMDDDPSVDVLIVRDADSRIHARDRYCIDHFLQSPFACHTIRDHNLHHSPMMGGLWGLKRGFLTIDLRMMYAQSSLIHPDQYGHDMQFLSQRVYPVVAESLIVYTFSPHLRISDAETIHIIPFDIEDKDFCGQVIIYDSETGLATREHDHPGQPYRGDAPRAVPELEADMRFRHSKKSRKVSFGTTLHPPPSSSPLVFPNPGVSAGV